MAERRATNKYYPPEWDPSKGSLNAYKNSHHLRQRARKADQGILVVRFEMPFSIWCLGCNNHIGMGVRYNAEKSKTGNYYSSPIYTFKMKCHLCDNYFEIQTNPKGFDYLILSGARKQVRMSNDDNSGDLTLAEGTNGNIHDAMVRLERKIEDKLRSDAAQPLLHNLRRWSSRCDDHFSTNQLLRSQYRERRKKIEQAKSKDRNLLQRRSLRIPLVKPSKNDRILAKELIKQRCDKVEELNKSELLGSSLSMNNPVGLVIEKDCKPPLSSL